MMAGESSEDLTDNSPTSPKGSRNNSLCFSPASPCPCGERPGTQAFEEALIDRLARARYCRSPDFESIPSIHLRRGFPDASNFIQTHLRNSAITLGAITQSVSRSWTDSFKGSPITFSDLQSLANPSALQIRGNSGCAYGVLQWPMLAEVLAAHLLPV